jgi:undecaprenyl-diphosphatase
MLVALFYPRWGWLAFLPALGVAYSRVYTGSHWPSDVVASLFIGLGSTLLLICILNWAWERFGGRWLSKVHQGNPTLLPS